MTAVIKDLVVLAADGTIEAAVRGILARRESLGIRPLLCDFFTHPYRDPGCAGEGERFLHPFQHFYSHALVVFDRIGCGRETMTREQLQNELTKRLHDHGWGDRGKAIVLDPELEVWVWSDSPKVDECLGWAGRQPPLRQWLADHELWTPGAAKPPDPKRAMELVLREAGKPRSSAIYAQLAASVSLVRCTDQAFLELKRILQQWFPVRQ